ncbi:hypothetical protein DSECCO2_495620 [anaerobic digester metagenome]
MQDEYAVASVLGCQTVVICSCHSIGVPPPEIAFIVAYFLVFGKLIVRPYMQDCIVGNDDRIRAR